MNGKSFVAGMATGAAILVAGMALAGAAQAPGKGAAKEMTLPPEATFQALNTGLLNVTNKKGDIVASITGESTGGQVVIYTNGGQKAAIIGVQGGGGGFTILDSSMNERVRLQPDGTVEVLGSGRDEVMARMAAFKSDGTPKSTSGRSDFSGQFSTYQKNGVLVDKLPR